MNLIETIEAAAAREEPYTEADTESAQEHYDALATMSSPWWHRIKAALEAAQEMDAAIDRDGYEMNVRVAAEEQRKFREAMK